MKILKIFGLVVGFHAALFLFVIAIPGCRSTAKTSADEPAPAAATIAAAPPPAMSFDPYAPAAGTRVAPTRPGSAAAITLAAPPPPVVPAPPPPPVTVGYTVKSGDSLWTIAKKNHLSVPVIAAANNLSTNATLHVSQKLLIPVAKSPVAATPAETGTTTYTVKSGDTLKGIAQRNHTTADMIRTLNNLEGDTVYAGRLLKLPVAAPSAAVLVPDAPATGGVTHIVKPGENLGTIAKKYGVKFNDIALANNITNPTRLKVGQELKIPGKQAPTVPDDAAPITPAPPPPSPPAGAPLFSFPPLSSGSAEGPTGQGQQGLPISPAPPPPTGPVIRIEDSGAPKIP